MFSSIAAAYSWIQSKIITAPVTVNVLPGIYAMGPMLFNEMQAPQLVFFVGSTSNPTSVKLVCSPPQCTSSSWFIQFGPGSVGMTFAGFWLAYGGVGLGLTGIGAGETIVTTSNKVITGFQNGFDVQFASLNAPLNAVNASSCFLALHGSVVDALSTTCYYLNIGFNAQRHSYIAADSSFVSGIGAGTGTGVFCDASSAVFIHGIVWGPGVTTQVNCANNGGV